MYKRRVLCASSFLFILSLLVCAITVRFHRVDCAHCKKNIYMLSTIEISMAYWRDVPMLHKGCLDYVSSVLAPNCDMTVAEYFEMRGWDLRHAETKGKTWSQIVK